MKSFNDFIKEAYDEDYWAKRLQQFQAAQHGIKGSVKSDRKQPIYQTGNSPIQFIKMIDGVYEQMTPEDEANGLTTLSRWSQPARDGSYYKKDKQGRWVIERPQRALHNFFQRNV